MQSKRPLHSFARSAVILALTCLGTSVQAASFVCANPGDTATLGPFTTDASSRIFDRNGNTETVRVYRHGSWWNPATSGEPGSWVSITNNSTNLGPYDVYFSETIEVDHSVVDPDSITVTLLGAADNYLDNFLVQPPAPGGLVTADTAANSFTTPVTFTLSNSGGALGFATGSHQIGLRIRNAETTQGAGNTGSPMGVYGKVTLTATCVTPPQPATAQPVPTMSLGGMAGMAGLLSAASLFALRRRKPR